MNPNPVLQLAIQWAFWVLVGFSPLLYLFWYRVRDGNLTTVQWLQLTTLLLLIGLFGRIPVISILAGLVILAIVVAWVWHQVILADVQYERALEQTHLFPDEETRLTWTIKNEKPLPVSWLRWQEAIRIRPFAATLTVEGAHLDSVDVGAIGDGSTDGLDEVTSLGAFQTLVKTTPVRALRRGFYQFGPAWLEGSDALGLYTAVKEFGGMTGLVVYPRLYTLAELDVPTLALLGDIRQRSSFIEDPSWYRGAREYRPTDAMKFIDWKVTARTRELQVKLFEPTAHPKLMIVANLHSFEHIWEGVITEHMEAVISTAASLAQWALDTGFEVGLHTNGALPDSQASLRLLPSAADDQLFVILDYLARIMLVVQRRVEDILRAETRDLPHGCTVLVCTSVVTGALTVALTELAQRQRVVLVLVNQGLASRQHLTIPNVTVVHAQPAGEAAA